MCSSGFSEIMTQQSVDCDSQVYGSGVVLEEVQLSAWLTLERRNSNQYPSNPPETQAGSLNGTVATEQGQLGTHGN